MSFRIRKKLKEYIGQYVIIVLKDKGTHVGTLCAGFELFAPTYSIEFKAKEVRKIKLANKFCYLLN